MKKVINILLGISFAAVITIAGCKDSVTGSEIDQRTIPDNNVSYPKHIQPVLTLKCNYSGCHNSEDMAGGLSLSSWAGATADPRIVFPGSPENSALVWAITGQLGGTVMPPPGYAPLTENQIEGIKTWIAEGAEAD